ncbi:MAG: hypothetical protein ACPMAG_10645, partial [Limisphaerales bacterium]
STSRDSVCRDLSTNSVTGNDFNTSTKLITIIYQIYSHYQESPVVHPNTYHKNRASIFLCRLALLKLTPELELTSILPSKQPANLLTIVPTIQANSYSAHI